MSEPEVLGWRQCPVCRGNKRIERYNTRYEFSGCEECPECEGFGAVPIFAETKEKGLNHERRD